MDQHDADQKLKGLLHGPTERVQLQRDKGHGNVRVNKGLESEGILTKEGQQV